MATYYVDSNATGAATGADWTNAFTTLAGADAVDAAGDTIYVAHDHAESSASAITLNFAGTLASPTKVICINKSTSALAATATVTTTGASTITLAGSGGIYVYGLKLSAGDGANVAGITLGGGNPGTATYQSCTFTIANSSAAGLINAHSHPTRVARVFWIDCSVKFGASYQYVSVNTQSFVWNGGSVLSGGTSPSALVQVGSGAFGSNILLSALDLSNLGATANIFGSGGGAWTSPGIVRDCKLPASWTGDVYGTTAVTARHELYNCDNADTNYRVIVKDHFGKLTQETTLVHSGGASDGTTPLSWKIVTTANAQFESGKFFAPEIVKWNETVGSSRTVAVEILRDSATALTDGDIWVEVLYLGTSGVPLGSVISDSKASAITSATDQDSSSTTWTTTGMTNPKKQKLSVTFTPQEKGFIHARVCVAKPSTTVYVDPKLTVT